MGPENTPKPPIIYINDVTALSHLMHLLEQIVKLQNELGALTNVQMKTQPKNVVSYVKL
jgi:hypothetical protein